MPTSCRGVTFASIFTAAVVVVVVVVVIVAEAILHDDYPDAGKVSANPRAHTSLTSFLPSSALTHKRNANSRADEHRAALLQPNARLLLLSRRTDRLRALRDEEDRRPVKLAVHLPPARGQRDLHDRKLRHGRVVTLFYTSSPMRVPWA